MHQLIPPPPANAREGVKSVAPRSGPILEGIAPAGNVLQQLVVAEPDDEVFHRLAEKLAGTDLRLLRTRTAAGTVRLCSAGTPALVLAPFALPDQSAWLMAAKLRLLWPAPAVWLHGPEVCLRDMNMASFLGVAGLIEYAGPPAGLASYLAESFAHLVQDRALPLVLRTGKSRQDE